MFGLLTSAFNFFMTSILRGSIIKFVFFTAVAYLISALGSIVSTLIGGAVNFSAMGSIFSQLPDGLLFFIGVFKLGVGLPLLLAAMVTRFAIRRIPFIG